MPEYVMAAENLSRFYPQRSVKIGDAYPPVKAVDGVSFALKAGETLSIIGESGCGKSTLGRLLVQLETQDAGNLTLAGQDAVALHRKDPLAFKRAAQIVFQNPFDAFNPRFTILKSMLRPLKIHGIGRNDGERKELCRQALVSAGLTPPDDFLRRFPHELSGGQLQRISILRSMLLEPRFMVADEPVSMLDVSVRADVMNLLQRLTSQRHMALVFISHDLATTRYIADRIAVMYLGRFVEIGASEEVLNHPLHPYTRALLSACGSVDQESFDPIEIAGEPPVPIGAGPGCYFAPRCFEAGPECGENYPPLMELAPGHFVSCCHCAMKGVETP
ncbi:MAG: ABC transporter ATP-binding protein [Clostridia bacterium]|nr:ABC transporter ATP-binding protein [Clostridia bacterium]